MPYSLIQLIHVLLFVFWVGTDVGVFLFTRYAQRETYSVEQRLLCLKGAGVLDRFPRVCFILILPVGAQLGATAGYLPLSSGQLAALWLADLAWLALALFIMFRFETALAQKLRQVDRAIQLVLLVSLGAIAAMQLLAVHPAMPGWLALKLGVYAGVCLLSLMLDFMSAPMVRGFTRLAEEGAGPEVQRILDRSIPPVLFVVLMIYVVCSCAAYFGLAKSPY